MSKEDKDTSFVGCKYRIGDYIFHKCKEFPLLIESKRILNIYEFYNETIFEICWFGSYAKCTVTKLHVGK